MRTLGIIVVTSLLASSVYAAPASQYQVIDLGKVVPEGFGEEGMVIGTMGTPEQAAILHPTMKLLGFLPNGQVSRGYARRERCNVGSSQALVNGIHHGFRDCEAGKEDMQSPDGPAFHAACYALANQTVGGVCEDVSGNRRPCFWLTGQPPTFLPTLGGLGGDVFAMTPDIRVGRSQTPSGIYKATKWTGSQQHPEDIDLAGPGPSQANDVNWGWEVVGWASFPEGIRGFHWENGVMTALGILPGGTQSQALSINDAGEIVGTSRVPNPTRSGFRAVYFEKGAVTDLNTRISSPGTVLEQAKAIGNDGRILASGVWNGEPRGFLLIPQESSPVVAQVRTQERDMKVRVKQALGRLKATIETMRRP